MRSRTQHDVPTNGLLDSTRCLVRSVHCWKASAVCLTARKPHALPLDFVLCKNMKQDGRKHTGVSLNKSTRGFFGAGVLKADIEIAELTHFARQ